MADEVPEIDNGKPVAEDVVAAEVSAETEQPVPEEQSTENGPEQDTNAEIAEAVRDLNQSIEKMQKSFDKYMCRTEMIDAIRNQFNEKVDSIVQKRITSSAVQIAQVTEEYLRLIRSQRKCIDKLTVESVIDSFENFTIDFENLLETFGVTPYDDPAGVPFTTPRHKVSGTIETDDVSKDRTVAETISRGYMEGDKVIVPQRVKVYKLKR